ncbi:uncharacterized protein A4U43_C08F12720 [Asparagus officinalis]|nr:uncharacterized protein A4U43_C08F12720 [Asparagus officinalis]
MGEVRTEGVRSGERPREEEGGWRPGDSERGERGWAALGGGEKRVGRAVASRRRGGARATREAVSGKQRRRGGRGLDEEQERAEEQRKQGLGSADCRREL